MSLVRSCTLLAALIVWAPAASDAAIAEYVLSGSITEIDSGEISSVSVGEPFEARLVIDLDTPCSAVPCNSPDSGGRTENYFGGAVVSGSMSVGSWAGSISGGLIQLLDAWWVFAPIGVYDSVRVTTGPSGAPLLDNHGWESSTLSVSSENPSLVSDPTSVPDLVTVYEIDALDLPESAVGIRMEMRFERLLPTISIARLKGVVESVVRSAPEECADLVDNDGDTLIDHPDDPDCWGSLDLTESPDCADGIDNDGDLLVDLADPGCVDGSDQMETEAAFICDNAIDDDLDGLTDSADPGCIDPTDTSEVSTTIACDDDIDNDLDGFIDLEDPGCSGSADLTEDHLPACNDGLDNDGDGLTDLGDPGCDDLEDPTEKWWALICDDGLDNDGDGLTDLDDPVCGLGPIFDREDAGCQDGMDNDGDGRIDFDGGVSAGLPPAEQTAPDAQCTGPADWSELSPPARCGLGVELALLLPLLAGWRRARRRPMGPSR